MNWKLEKLTAGKYLIALFLCSILIPFFSSHANEQKSPDRHQKKSYLEKRIIFEYISLEQGRSQSSVTSIAQDKKGFKHPDFQYTRHEIKDLSINLSKSEDVAWFYCVLNDINTFKGQSANWENARWTGVLEKREGRWVIVQQYFSFAAD